MFKTIRLASAGVFAAGAAVAGAVAYVAPAAPEMIEEAAPMGSSGAWIIPLIAIALIGVAIAVSDDDSESEDSVVDESVVDESQEQEPALIDER